METSLLRAESLMSVFRALAQKPLEDNLNISFIIEVVCAKELEVIWRKRDSPDVGKDEEEYPGTRAVHGGGMGVGRGSMASAVSPALVPHTLKFACNVWALDLSVTSCPPSCRGGALCPSAWIAVEWPLEARPRASLACSRHELRAYSLSWLRSF